MSSKFPLKIPEKNTMLEVEEPSFGKSMMGRVFFVCLFVCFFQFGEKINHHFLNPHKDIGLHFEAMWYQKFTSLNIRIKLSAATHFIRGHGEDRPPLGKSQFQSPLLMLLTGRSVEWTESKFCTLSTNYLSRSHLSGVVAA